MLRASGPARHQLGCCTVSLFLCAYLGDHVSSLSGVFVLATSVGPARHQFGCCTICLFLCACLGDRSELVRCVPCCWLRALLGISLGVVLSVSCEHGTGNMLGGTYLASHLSLSWRPPCCGPTARHGIMRSVRVAVSRCSSVHACSAVFCWPKAWQVIGITLGARISVCSGVLV